MRDVADTGRPGSTADDALRRGFRTFNRYFMVPAFRLGLGPLLGNPITGYIMVLKTVGRKTGKVRYTPVNYAIRDSRVYCIVGFGKIAHWYRNLRAHPDVELLMPQGPLAGVAETVSDPEEALSVLRQVLKNGGFAGFGLGLNPFTAPDAALRERTAGIPVVRIRPTGVAAGSADPGGWLWLWPVLATTGLIIRRMLRGRRRHRPASA